MSAAASSHAESDVTWIDPVICVGSEGEAMMPRIVSKPDDEPPPQKQPDQLLLTAREIIDAEKRTQAAKTGKLREQRLAREAANPPSAPNTREPLNPRNVRHNNAD